MIVAAREISRATVLIGISQVDLGPWPEPQKRDFDSESASQD